MVLWKSRSRMGLFALAGSYTSPLKLSCVHDSCSFNLPPAAYPPPPPQLTQPPSRTHPATPTHLRPPPAQHRCDGARLNMLSATTVAPGGGTSFPLPCRAALGYIWLRQPGGGGRSPSTGRERPTIASSSLFFCTNDSPYNPYSVTNGFLRSQLHLRSELVDPYGFGLPLVLRSLGDRIQRRNQNLPGDARGPYI